MAEIRQITNTTPPTGIVLTINPSDLLPPHLAIEKYTLSFLVYEKKILLLAIKLLEVYSKGKKLKSGFIIKHN